MPRIHNAALPDARGYERSVRDNAPLRLVPTSKELCRAFYRVFAHDPALFEDESKLVPYVYDEAAADAKFEDRQKRVNNRPYYIMLGEAVIGELVFKNVDAENKRCEMGICLVNDSVKNKGFGTAAERLALDYAFGELGMETVLADCLLKNTRSQHVLQKVGFRFVSEDEHMKYYRITRAQYEAQNAEA